MDDQYSLGRKYERPRHKGLKVLVLLCTLMAITILPAMAARGGHGGGGGGGSAADGAGSCSVTPNSVASGATLTVSGSAGHSGGWVNVYIYYSDGAWGFIGGSSGGGGGYSLSGAAQETHSSFWGPFYPAGTGQANVEVSAGTASKNYGVVNTCSFTVT